MTIDRLQALLERPAAWAEGDLRREMRTLSHSDIDITRYADAGIVDTLPAFRRLEIERGRGYALRVARGYAREIAAERQLPGEDDWL